MVTTRPPKTIVKLTALGPVANTDTKLLIYGLFQKGRVLAQDGLGGHSLFPKNREFKITEQGIALEEQGKVTSNTWGGIRVRLRSLCLLFLHPRAPNLIGLRSAGTMPT